MFQLFYLIFLLSCSLDDISDRRQEEPSASRSQKNIVPPLASSLSPKWLSEHSAGKASSGVKVVLRSLAWARPQGRLFRTQRHTHSRGLRGQRYPHQNQLIRVGCALGTCQVQNLSHRLYQLIGQSGRDSSSPINPKSPHSYGWITWPLQTPTASQSVHHFFISWSFCFQFHVVSVVIFEWVSFDEDFWAYSAF